MLKNIKSLEPRRFYTAFFMLVAVVLIVIFHTPFLLWLTLGCAFIIGFYEAYKLYNKTTPPLSLTTLAILSWCGVYFYENALPLFVSLVLLGAYQGYTKKGKLEQMMPFIYPSIPFVFLYLLYLDDSINAIIWLLFIVGLTDTFAYIGGKIIGGQLFKNSAFCPTSPNKTKEGVLIGIVMATLFGSLVGLGVCGFFTSLFLSFIASFVSVFGDLYESFLKRSAEVKDSGNLFPGHGGILDRLDGYFFSVIVLYALLRIFT